jgi:GxxExxY protein
MEQGETEEQRRYELTGQIIAACIEVHRHLGPGLLESAYEHCLTHELGLRGFRLQRQVQIPLHYKGLALDCGYRLDLVVESRLVVEVKAVERLLPVHEAQVITYLKLLRLPLGLLVNFHVPVLREGLRRLVNPTLAPSGSPFLPVGPSDPTSARSG